MYRQLCMLYTSGKLFEKLLKPRLQSGRSTIDALRKVNGAATIIQRGSHCSRPVLLLVTLDVKNAFNTHRWSDVLNAFKYNFSVPHYKLAMISSYLSNRQLMYNISSRPRVKYITSGAVQASMVGPGL